MPRPSSPGYSISKLKSLLQAQMGKRGELMKARRKLQKQIDKIDRQLTGLTGSAGGSGGGGIRVRNEKNLVTHMEEVLAKAPKGLGVAEIVEAVQANGYRSKSANFRGIVNQTLIKEKKKFTSTGTRGMYMLKK